MANAPPAPDVAAGSAPRRRFRWPRISLRHRVMMLLVVLIASMVAVYGATQIYQEYRVMTSFLGESSASFANCVKHACLPALRARDIRLLQATVVMAHQQHASDLSYILVQDDAGDIVASSPPAWAGATLSDSVSGRAVRSVEPLRQDVRGETAALYGGVLFDLSVPVLFGEDRSGVVRVGVSAKGVSRRIREGIVTGLVMLIVALAIGGGVAWLVDRRLGGALHELTRVARRMAGGDLSARARIRTGDEIEVLGDTLNGMAMKLAAAQDAIREWGEQMEEKVRSRTRELEEERQKLDGIVRSIGAGLVLVDRELRVLWTNAAMPEGIAVPANGTSACCHEALWREPAPCRDCASRRAFQSGRLEQCEKSLLDHASRRRYYQVTASPIRSAGGRVDHVLELIQDITGKKQMEAQLVQAGKMVAMGELAASIAHEINNPLAVMGAHVGRMKSALDAADGNPAASKRGLFSDGLDTVERHVFRCKDIILRLLNFARRKELEFQPTDLPSIVTDAIRLLEHDARLGGKEILFHAAPDVPVFSSDPDGLEQVCINLISNALDAIPGQGQVRVEVRRKEHEAVLSVADTGTGIPEDQIPRVFEPFYTTKRAGKGTGLGLAICSRIVERLQGRIAVRSCLGRGTVFEVRIPIRESEDRAHVR